MAKTEYSPEQVETCLVYLAMSAGSLSAALKRLAEDGELTPPKQTLHQWQHKTHAGRYQALLAQKEQQRRDKSAARLEALSNRDLDLYETYQDRLEEALEEGTIEVRDITRGMRDLALAMGIKTDKSNVLRDRPTQVTEHKHSVEQIDKALEKLLSDHEKTVEGTYEEDAPAQLTE